MFHGNIHDDQADDRNQTAMLALSSRKLGLQTNWTDLNVVLGSMENNFLMFFEIPTEE